MRRVLADGCFREIGLPRIVVESPAGDLIAVGGILGRPLWQGASVESRSTRGVGWEPVGVYRADDMRCVHLFTSRWPVNAFAFHPSLPILAVGTGSYDGGYCYEGQLLILDLRTGSRVSVLEWTLMVEALTWSDASTLDVVFAPLTDEADAGKDGAPPRSIHATLVRDDWGTARPKMISWSRRSLDGATRVPRCAPPDPVLATAALQAICARRSARWTPRRSVWAIEVLPDGRILAGLEGTTLECWPPDAAAPAWSVPAAEGRGCQIALSTTGQQALTNTLPMRYDPTAASLVHCVSVVDGTARTAATVDHPAVLITRTDGTMALRDAGHDPRAAHPITVLDPTGAARGRLTTSGYDLFNHHFPIRDAPDLLILLGETSRPSRNKWVATIEPAGEEPGFTIRRLFPLEWDPDRNRHLFGGPGVFLRDAQGAAIIHATAIHDGAGLLPGNALIVRRDYPTGRLRWEYHLDNQITALDADGARIVATTNLGELLILHADDGALLHRQHLRLNGHAIVPLSLRVADPNRAWVGTHDGRILEIELSITGDY
ncbi:hypothetical protein [Dactylosporangium sp. CA-139066]|uniref:hypothetical protein n=1 Tax=Dactylosporangium sp. CA-139066 TaxID=3239930 RepID=UPI003D89C9E5